MLIERPDSGTYVAFEGIKGVGKTYTSRKLEAKHGMDLIPEELPPVLGPEINEGLRATGDVYGRDGHPVVEGLQFISMRMLELTEYVIPKLEEGRTVIQDRGLYSTPVYCSLIKHRQDPSRSVETYFEELNEVQETLSCTPDVTFYFHDEFESCLERLRDRDGDRYSDAEIELMREVHKYYPRLLGDRPDVHLIDFREHDESEVHERIAETVAEIRDGNRQRPFNSNR